MPERPALRTRRTQPIAITRRELLVAGAVGAGSLLARPIPALGVETERVTLHRFVRDTMAAGRIPGLSAAVVRDGDVAWSQSWGLADVQAGKRVTGDTLFMLASVSKTVIATAVLQAVEAGLFGLDDDVNTVLPFRVRNPVHPEKAITVRQLLTHTSSVRDNWTVLIASYVSGDARLGLGDFLRRYLTQAGEDFAPNNYYAFGPGKAYRYANMGASLAAYLVESASGIGFDDWCEEKIFTPLGMDRAGWHLAGLPLKDIALPYRWAAAKGYVSYGQYGYPDYPDGQLRTTAPLLARHLAMVMNFGEWRGNRLLSEATVRELRRGQIPHIEPGQGLIWYYMWRNGRTLIGHEGGDSGVATVCFFDRRANTGVVALANADWRLVKGDWALRTIMDRLFDEAPRLG